MTPPDFDPRWVSRLHRMSSLASGMVLALGLTVLLGWAFDVPVLKSVHPSLVTMKANTALLFVVLGVGLWLARGGERSRARRLLGLVVAAVAGVTFAEYVFGVDFRIDELLFRDTPGTPYPGRMSPITATIFVLLGAALALPTRGRSFRASQTATLVATTAALASFCGYLYGVTRLHEVGKTPSIALHTTLGFLMAGCALLFARPTSGVVRLLASDTGAARLLRRLLPAVVLGPIALGWIRLEAQLRGLYDTRVGLALMVLSNVILLTVLTSALVSSLQRSEVRLRDVLRERSESEHRLRQAQQVARIGTFDLNIPTGVNTWTPELEAMYGLPVGGFARTQAAWEDLVHPDDRAAALRLVDRAFETYAPVEGEWRVRWPDGTMHWLAGRFQVFTDADRRPVRFTGVNIDITDRKNVEEERERLLSEVRDLNRSLETRVEERTREIALAKQRLDGIISLAADAIVSIDDEDRITIFNKGAEEIFGWSQSEILGQPLDLLIPPRFRAVHKAHIAAFGAAPITSRRTAGRREIFGLRKNGEEFRAEAAISKLAHGSGHVFTVILRDISERKRIEDERQVFVSLLENSPDFIGIADPNGKPLYLNPAGRRMVGLPPDFPVEQLQIQDCYPKELRSFANDVILKTMLERGRWSGETFFRHFQTEQAIPVSDEHFLIRDPSGKRVLGMGTVTRDISGARRAAAERDHWYVQAMELFDQAADGIFIADLDGRFTDVNASACKMLGYAREELVGKTIADITPPEDAPRLAATRQHLLTPGMVEVAEWTQLRKDGAPVAVEVSSKILRDRRWLTFVREISERKRMADELKESENKFRTLAEVVPQLVWITRPDGWNIYVNPQWVKYTGLTVEETHGHGWNKPFHPDDSQRAWDAWQQAVRTDGVYSLECRLRRADGVYRWWLIRGVSLHDESGKVINWFGTCTDVNDIKETEEALRRARDELAVANDDLRSSEERFRLTIDEAPIGMALVALDGRFVRVNRALCEIVDYTPDELTNVTFQDITHPDDLETDVALAAQLARGDIPRYQLEKRYIRRDGTTVEIMLSGSVLRGRDGAPLYYIAQIEDITGRKRMEEERAKTLKERETLLKEIHHRVKNNLQVLSSLFYLQRQRTAQEPLRVLLDESRNRIQSIALIHEQLYQSERLAWIEFGDYLRELTGRLAGAMGVPSRRVAIRIQAENVYLDIERAIPCALIVNELVSNALKHAFPDGRSGDIWISIAPVARDRLSLVVRDSGVGFPADLDFRKTSTLGMQLVCSLTTQLRGTVSLTREGGTRFEIQFSAPAGFVHGEKDGGRLSVPS